MLGKMNSVCSVSSSSQFHCEAQEQLLMCVNEMKTKRPHTKEKYKYNLVQYCCYCIIVTTKVWKLDVDDARPLTGDGESLALD